MVTPNSSMCVKSDAPSRPGGAAAQRTPPGPDPRLLATPSPAAATCAPARPESAPDSVAARTRRPSWPQARRCLQTTSAHRPRHPEKDLVGSVPAPPPVTGLATGHQDDTSAPSSRPSLPWTPQSPGFPLSLSTQTTSEPACL